MALHPGGPHAWLDIKFGNPDYHLQRQYPQKFNFGLLEVHFCKHSIALPIPLVLSFMEQGKLVDHMSELERKSFYVERRCMGFDIDPKRVSGSEKECSCFEENFLVPEGLPKAMQEIIV
ncbi:hypothetical protein PVL29_002612 [Vitis rotundifolia]|uniref:Uncharacterized protein n=1 Tax=Vitis rotundifolia TaxID=103349 RepID=A0AA39E5X3_VITRO|nr:hypothetical protein PVL29_002612 [Vitis rotundifolia]